jgi:hypothetical protein
MDTEEENSEVETDFGPNGHGSPEELIEERQVKGAVFKLEQMKRGDGNVVKSMEAQLGVLQRIVTAPQKNEEYRQALLLANFLSPEEADRAVNAIAWCNRYDGDLGPIVDKLIARCAVKGGRVADVIDALTHMRLTTNYSGRQDGSNPRSPIRNK